MTPGEVVARFLIVGGAIFAVGLLILVVAGVINRTDKFSIGENVGLCVMVFGAFTAFAAMFVT